MSRNDYIVPFISGRAFLNFSLVSSFIKRFLICTFPSGVTSFFVTDIKNIEKWSEISSLIIPVFIVLCKSEFVMIWSMTIAVFYVSRVGL